MRATTAPYRRNRIGRSRDEALYQLAGRLTERDRLLCRLLFDHRVLTTPQITDVAFSSLRKAQARLAFLYGAGVVDRFQSRSWAGTGPLHFTLGPAGAAVIAAERGVTVGDLGWQRDTATALSTNRQLAHLVGCNGVFTRLVRSTRQHPDCRLAEWWSARRCAQDWGQLVRPDAYAVWVENAVRLPCCFEYDTGTENLSRLEAKLCGYARLARAVGHPTWVLFAFPSPRREASARQVLGHSGVPVATAVLDSEVSPAGPHWLAVGDAGPRRRLIGLGHPAAALVSRETW